jgi:hypothetical protein
MCLMVARLTQQREPALFVLKPQEKKPALRWQGHLGAGEEFLDKLQQTRFAGKLNQGQGVICYT